MSYSAIIIDDELKPREVLAIKLATHCKNVTILAKLSNAIEGHEAILTLNPDIVFLDINMPSESGFDMLARFDHIDFEIIFVTGYDEFGLEALKVSAVDYLLKPINTEDLIEAVQKAQKRLDQSEMISRYKTLMHNVKNTDQDARFIIPGSTQHEFVYIKNIIRCEGWYKYTRIYLESGEVIISSYNIGVFRERLQAYEFYETHKSHLINIRHISRYQKDGSVTMSDKSLVPVSRRKRDEFLNQFVR